MTASTNPIDSPTGGGGVPAPPQVIMLQEAGPGVPQGANVVQTSVGNAPVTYATWTGLGSVWNMYFLPSNTTTPRQA